jgi:glycosyltransferase involved in cell wall biosynthesis
MPQKFANISVVFPALNEEDKIANCLSALVNQKTKPKQIIFVNHNSTDNTLKISQTFKPVFEQQKVEYIIITEKEKGIANARNAGFSLATQPIIASTDSDCMARENWIESIDNFFKKNKDVVACAGKIVHYDADPLWKKITESGFYYFAYKFLQLVSGFHPMTTANCAVKKSAFEKVGKFDRQIIDIDGLDDIDLAARLSFVGKVKYNNSMVVESSFRRWNSVPKAIGSTWRRFLALVRVKKKFSQLQFNEFYKSAKKFIE